MEKLSVFITTFNNERTLPACLASVAWADEVVVLDSFSSDASLELARRHGCVCHQHRFLGYGRQKQLAMERTSHRWVLLLDADEALSPELQAELQALLARGPQADGYLIPRLEQLFWRMCSRSTAMNRYLRLFDKHKARFTDMPVHAAPRVEGRIDRLHAPFYHFGEPSIHVKTDKVNAYSSGLVTDKLERGRNPSAWILVLYPPLFFLRLFVLKRNFVNGWAGFITSVIGAFYVFLKYAKLYEHRERERYGATLMPPGAPPPPPDDGPA